MQWCARIARLTTHSCCGTGNKNQQSDLSKIVKLIMERNYDPVIIFSFSKR